MTSLIRHLGALHHTHSRDRALFTGRGALAYSRVVPWLIGPYYTGIARQVARTVPPGAHVLDVGTGPGALAAEIARRAPTLRVTGIDLSPDMIQHARRRATRLRLDDRVTFERADAAALPLPDGSIDLVVSTLSVHHWTDLPRVLRDLARVTRPGDKIWLFDAWGLRFNRDAVTQAIASLPLSLDEYAARGPGLLGRWITRVSLGHTK